MQLKTVCQSGYEKQTVTEAEAIQILYRIFEQVNLQRPVLYIL